jgi:Flp pilus assembly protein TadG
MPATTVLERCETCRAVRGSSWKFLTDTEPGIESQKATVRWQLWEWEWAVDQIRYRRVKARRGAAVVEFAFVAPLLFAVILGIMEFGRGMMVAEMLTSAARAGCRAASLSGASTSSATTVLNTNLTGISGSTIVMTVNGATQDVNKAVSGDTVAVTVTVPYNSVSWLPTASSSYLAGLTLSGTASMVRE